MTEDYPPYNYPDKNGKPTGLSVDIMREMLKDLKHKDDIKIYPWARSYKIIQKESNKILFVMTRTSQRERMFKWVGPIANNSWVFFANINSNIKINTLGDAKQYKIGTYKDDACEQFLKNEGFLNLRSVSKDKLNIRKLAKGRIDLWIAGEGQGIFKAKRENLAKKIKKVYEIKNTELYIAFSKDTSDKEIKRWQESLEKLKKNGTYKKIIDKYLK
jgi:polar amino acid transport system substrate-binding protein